MASERKSIIQVATDLATGTQTFTVKGAGSFTVDLLKVAGAAFVDLSENGKYALAHGVKQKVSDKAAFPRDTTSGRSATPAEKYDAMREVAERLDGGGAWNLHGGGSSTPPLDRASLFAALGLASAEYAARTGKVAKGPEVWAAQFLRPSREPVPCPWRSWDWTILTPSPAVLTSSSRSMD